MFLLFIENCIKSDIIINITFNIGFNTMIALSIHLPENIAKASQEVSKELGISRTQFIRQAVIHELQNFKTQREREEIAKSFQSMSKHEGYLQESELLDKGFEENLPDDSKNWWE